ncbi:hypothetical protein [Actinoplanes philippinensis]|uniref:hypothetical protein n=1 Tax=Actinoplanes philippinensis TaxID=35752 RepID=UPI00340EDCD0
MTRHLDESPVLVLQRQTAGTGWSDVGHGLSVDDGHVLLRASAGTAGPNPSSGCRWRSCRGRRRSP